MVNVFRRACTVTIRMLLVHLKTHHQESSSHDIQMGMQQKIKQLKKNTQKTTHLENYYLYKSSRSKNSVIYQDYI